MYRTIEALKTDQRAVNPRPGMVFPWPVSCAHGALNIRCFGSPDVDIRLSPQPAALSSHGLGSLGERALGGGFNLDYFGPPLTYIISSKLRLRGIPVAHALESAVARQAELYNYREDLNCADYNNRREPMCKYTYRNFSMSPENFMQSIS